MIKAPIALGVYLSGVMTNSSMSVFPIWLKQVMR